MLKKAFRNQICNFLPIVFSLLWCPAHASTSGIIPSSQYKAEIVTNGKSSSTFVYLIQNPAFLPNGQSSGITTSSTLEQATSWTSFPFHGVPVKVEITNQKPFTAARILPSSYKIKPTIKGRVVKFTISDAYQQLAVDFCYKADGCPTESEWDITNPMLVFTNSPQEPCPRGALKAVAGQSVPALNSSQNMICFGPGVYDLGLTPYVLGMTSSGHAQNAYLAGGAYVKGTLMIQSGTSGTKIEGGGILSGENFIRGQCQQIYGGTSCPYMINGMGSTGNIVIKGITLIDAPFYNIMLGGEGNTVRNVKALSWFAQTDGIAAAGSSPKFTRGSNITNSFFKVGDDAIKLFSSGLTVSHCNIWQLNNAAPFEFGVNQLNDENNVKVEDSNVLRSEEVFSTRSNAVFNSALGGNALVSNFEFNNIHVENSNLQLFKITIVPNIYTKPGRNLLGSISHLTFNNINVTDAQTLPDLFQSFDLPHQVSNVVFNHVAEGGVKMPSPTIAFNANRNMSLGGTVFSGLLWRSTAHPDNFQISLFSGTATNPSSTLSMTQSQLTAEYKILGVGDFYGDGNASALVEDAANNQLSVWKDPAFTNSIYPLTDANGQQITAMGSFAGVGDFNGDGYTDILFWNTVTQTGEVFLMNGAGVTSTLTVQPVKASIWSVVGVGDFHERGYSDIMLRDTKANVEILHFGKGGIVGSADFVPGNLYYNSTSYYTKTWSAVSGHFDTHWTVAGIGDTQGNGYASIIWTNPTTNQMAITNFDWTQDKVRSGQVFANLPAGSQIVAMGDYNGDATKDLLLYNAATGQYTIWNLNYFGGNLYQPGPILSPNVDPDWQIQGVNS